MMMLLLEEGFLTSLPCKHNLTEPDIRSHETPCEFILAASCSSSSPVNTALDVCIPLLLLSCKRFKIGSCCC